MSSTQGPARRKNPRRRDWGRLSRDILLLPPALIYVIVERIFWTGAKALLGHAVRVQAVQTLQSKVQLLPAWAVLPLFLVPEIFSHIGGFWASDLLLRRQWMTAVLVGIFIKGTATLMEVWIYQSCQKTLLSIRWFAWLHGQFLRGRDWVATRLKPIAAFARRLIRVNRPRLTTRFAAVRAVVAAKLGLRRR